jgi:hypothetical protein
MAEKKWSVAWLTELSGMDAEDAEDAGRKALAYMRHPENKTFVINVKNNITGEVHSFDFSEEDDRAHSH